MKKSHLIFIIAFPFHVFCQINFSDEILISSQNIEPVLVVPADINNDENMDLLSISGGDNRVCWFENLGGSGTFSTLQLISNSYQGPSCIADADFNDDSFQDIVVSYYFSDLVVWFKNVDGNGTFEEQTAIDNFRDGAHHVSTADIDADGDEDILVASWEDDTFAWYENLDGLGSFSTANIIDDNAAKACRIIPGDVDQDGDTDIVVGTNYTNDEIYWFENTDGFGTFLQREIISTEVDNLLSIWVINLDGDDDLDILSASTNDNKTAWYENLDGNGNFGNQQIISTDTEDAFQVSTADLDNDNDEDVIISCGFWNKIVYFLNDGNQNFGDMNFLWHDASFVHSTLAADFDNDDDQDLVSAFWGSDKIVWFRNGLSVSLDDELHNPTDPYFFRNYPNPFNPSTTITFNINNKQTEQYELGIYNLKGQKVKSFDFTQDDNGGIFSVVWNGTNDNDQPVSSGIYLCKLQQGNRVQTRKIELLK